MPSAGIAKLACALLHGRALPAEALRTTVRAAVVDGRAGYRAGRGATGHHRGRVLPPLTHPLGRRPARPQAATEPRSEVTAALWGSHRRSGWRAPHPTNAPSCTSPTTHDGITCTRRLPAGGWRISAQSFFPVPGRRRRRPRRPWSERRPAPSCRPASGPRPLQRRRSFRRRPGRRRMDGDGGRKGFRRRPRLTARVNLVADDEVNVVHADVTTWAATGRRPGGGRPEGRNGLGRSGVDVVVAGVEPRRVDPGQLRPGRLRP